MKLVLDNIAKKFSREWVFRGLSYSFEANSSTALLGPNGSGKSTLMQIIAGYLSPAKGQVNFLKDDKYLSREQVPSVVSYAAPYIELIEELTLAESIDFHFKFKKLKQGFSQEELISLGYLNGNEDKQVRFFSSGMKQRLKLLLALFTDTPLLLLDEPCTNLDSRGVEWYREIMSTHTADQTLIIASNQVYEYDFCRDRLDISGYR